MIAILSIFDNGAVIHQAVTVPDPSRIESGANHKLYAQVAAGRGIKEVTYPTQAITVRQPWAWAIEHAGKDVENRSRSMGRPGWYFLHAGQANVWASSEYAEAALQMWKRARKEPPKVTAPEFVNVRYGGVIGLVKLGPWETAIDSPWFQGPLGARIEAFIPLPFQAGAGKQGIFAWDHATAEVEA